MKTRLAVLSSPERCCFRARGKPRRDCEGAGSRDGQRKLLESPRIIKDPGDERMFGRFFDLGYHPETEYAEHKDLEPGTGCMSLPIGTSGRTAKSPTSQSRPLMVPRHETLPVALLAPS